MARPFGNPETKNPEIKNPETKNPEIKNPKTRSRGYHNKDDGLYYQCSIYNNYDNKNYQYKHMNFDLQTNPET